PGFFIGRADVVPDIHGDERKRVIFRKNDFETTLQLVLLKRNRRQLVRWRLSGLAGGSCSQKQGRAQQTRDRPACNNFRQLGHALFSLIPDLESYRVSNFGTWLQIRRMGVLSPVQTDALAAGWFPFAKTMGGRRI